ncbi:MAG: putative Ig domain-containing protein [Mycobacteriales bacterium]
MRKAPVLAGVASAALVAAFAWSPSASAANPAANPPGNSPALVRPATHQSHAGPATTHPTRHVCSQRTTAGGMSCLALARTDVAHHTGVLAAPAATPSGYGPSQLQSAYKLAASAGGGQTVALVDAYDDPNAESDLATYRSQYGLPACTTANGCFRKVNQSGGTSYPSPPPANDDWTGEISLDVDMVSAACPQCHILLVETTSPTTANLGTGVDTAVSLGAKFVSNSYGGSESSSESSTDTSYYKHAGVVVTASSCDGGYGVEYPAASPWVTAVGGTSLSTASTSRGWTESAWNGAGSGCSRYETKPSFQTDAGCARRTVADVSAVADPNTGVAVYDTYGSNGGWNVYGGTSASSPIIASVYALAGTPAAGTYPNSYPYSHTSSLFDVTSGSNGSCSPGYLCTAGTGYDGPTGLGTPNGSAAFASSGGGGGGGTVTVTNPGNQTGTVGTAVSLQVSASDTDGGTLTYSASGLPGGLTIGSSTGKITGTPTTAATSNVTVTATDSTGPTGTASFSWTINAAGGGGGCTAAQLLGNPGFETGSAPPWTATSGVIENTNDGPSHSGTYFAWLDGYGSSHTDTLAQTVSVPASCTNASLTFWLYVSTRESGSTPYDTLKVRAGSTTLATYSNANASGGYGQRTISLKSYVGRSVALKFTGTEDSSLATSFLIDDAAINVS